MAAKRIADEPAFMLHRYDWSESSLILEVFTRHHGRTALVAKGVKKPSSSFRPILLPLQPLQIAFGGDAEIRTLKAAEWVGGHVMPCGEALLSGYYLNELLLKLLARDDPHTRLFDCYAAVVRVLASAQGELLQAALRSFELLLLRELGLLPTLDLQTLTQAPLQDGTQYTLQPESGLRACAPTERGLSASQWRSLQAALGEHTPYTTTLRACAALMHPLKTPLRTLLHYHCGVGTLRTRQLMMDIQAL